MGVCSRICLLHIDTLRCSLARRTFTFTQAYMHVTHPLSYSHNDTVERRHARFSVGKVCSRHADLTPERELARDAFPSRVKATHSATTATEYPQTGSDPTAGPQRQYTTYIQFLVVPPYIGIHPLYTEGRKKRSLPPSLHVDRHGTTHHGYTRVHTCEFTWHTYDTLPNTGTRVLGTNTNYLYTCT